MAKRKQERQAMAMSENNIRIIKNEKSNVKMEVITESNRPLNTVSPRALNHRYKAVS